MKGSTDQIIERKLRLKNGELIRCERLIHDNRRPGWESQVFEAVGSADPRQKFAVKWYGGSLLPDAKKPRAQYNARRAFSIGRLLGDINTARIIDLVDEVFLVTEWVNGPNLGQVMLSGKYSRTRAESWVLAIGEALAGLTEALTPRRAGCGHGDVQPSNILLDSDRGRRAVKIVDLDYMGRSVPRPEPLTEADLAWAKEVGQMVLKPPEYALGTAFLDTCSDVFSYGLIACWLLQGAPAFNEKDEYFRKILMLAEGQRANNINGWPSGVWALRQNPLGKVLMGMTAFQREKRYRSVAEAHAALKALLPQN